jgi:hypothetical protein
MLESMSRKNKDFADGDASIQLKPARDPEVAGMSSL